MDSDCGESYRYKYDVFISFRGPDTRNTFVSHLHGHLSRKGISTFKDDKSLQKGESLSHQLLQAIQDSRLSIVVFSKDYASSTWCLDEMAAIDESGGTLKQGVFPVFYDIDPSHVRKQSGVYEDAFVLHAELFKHNPDKVSRWKRAMTSLAGSAGWDVRNKPEFEQIEQIVQAVIKKLGHKFSWSADDLIGIQTRLEALESLLKPRPKDDSFKVLGIRGMDGIGKTTLATVLYDRISYQFDACCYIVNVRKVYEDGGARALQKQILCQIIEEKILDTYSPSEIASIVRNRLQHIKLLVVLDNVDQIEQLLDLDIKHVLLRPESRLIIITRDEHILRAYGSCMVYEVELMNDNEAHKLLCRKAFAGDYSSSTFSELIPEVLKYTQGLPLAIKVIGSFLHSRNDKQWRATLNRWKISPPHEILKVLQVSYDGLSKEDKEIFLHVACFFKGERKDYVSRVLDACNLQPDIGIPLLAEKSLITIKNEEIHMHEMLQELGKKIVRGEHPDEPGFWSRLWLYRDFHHVMMTEKKAIEAEAIILNLKEEDFEFNDLRAEDLPKMESLKLLILNHKNFSGRPSFLSNSLRYLLWNGYPFISLPSNFQPYRIVELNMPHSSVEQLWVDIQQLPYLKRMDLSNSKNLKRTPCFKGMQKLERLDFSGCISLYDVHPSIGLLRELQFLSLQNCTSLVCFEFGGVSKSSSLRVLCLSGCTKLGNTPDFKGLLNLEYLDMDQCTSLYKIDKSIGDLSKLRFLSLRGCTNLVSIPDSFNNMTNLMTLDLCGCSRFTNLPLGSISGYHTQQSLISLDLSFCNISIVPDAIGELRDLERLNLQGNNFTELPCTIQRLSSLAYLNLSHCHRLQILPLSPIESDPSDSVGRYFQTKSGSRDLRSGLYVFDCPKIKKTFKEQDVLFEWLLRLVKEPRNFRCGFDIILSSRVLDIPYWFDYYFNRGAIIRIKESDMHVDWLGFVFCIVFEVSNHSEVSDSPHQSLSSPMPHPFYLSFESEHTEERFDMPLNLERNMVDGKGYLWTIYMSREHCHFVNTGAQITFKARHGLVIKEWGLNVITREKISDTMLSYDSWPALFRKCIGHPLEIVEVKQSSSSIEPKIQLPYNWLVSVEECVENDTAKGKETGLFNLGLLTERPQ